MDRDIKEELTVAGREAYKRLRVENNFPSTR
jgi:hypothetical protein